jgi:organic hydroperoxide reductase OsmC/OhrA
MTFPEANIFLRQTGPLSDSILESCSELAAPPSGFERIWAAFEPMEVMQKRGQIVRPRTGEAWQLLCDEGTGLGGTDWAPPPLAYFAAGMASSVTPAIKERVGARAVSTTLDNNYSLSGSILRGTMEGKGYDPNIAVRLEDDTLTSMDKSGLVLEAVSSGLAGYLMKSVFRSEFCMIANGTPVNLDLPDWEQDIDAAALQTTALDPARESQRYITKAFLRPDDPTYNTKGGSGHDTEQNRTLKVSAATTSVTGDVITMDVGINRPGAGVYETLGTSDAGAVGAPSSASLIAAGIGFCYMTQLGRYAEAKKRPVSNYRMIQAIDIPLPDADGSQTPVIGTKLFLNQDGLDDDFARDLAHSARRTCFLHATLQNSLRSRITVS